MIGSILIEELVGQCHQVVVPEVILIRDTPLGNLNGVAVDVERGNQKRIEVTVTLMALVLT